MTSILPAVVAISGSYGVTAQLAREVISESLFVFDLGLLSFIVMYLSRQHREYGFRVMRTHMGTKAAVAIGVHIFGLTIIRGWTTAMYVLNRAGLEEQAIVTEERFEIALIGLLIAVLGMGCTIRIFSPRHWGNVGWLLVFFIAIAFVSYIQLGAI